MMTKINNIVAGLETRELSKLAIVSIFVVPAIRSILGLG